MASKRYNAPRGTDIPLWLSLLIPSVDNAVQSKRHYGTMRRPDRTYGSRIIKQMAKSCIYAWRRRKQWLYIGRSRVGLSRILGAHHINIVQRFRKGDRLVTWHCTGEAELANLEMALIRRYRPKYNVTGQPPPQKTKAQMRRDADMARRMLESMRRQCEYPKCKETFIPRTETQRYHNAVCRNAHWQDQHPRQYMAFRYMEP